MKKLADKLKELGFEPYSGPEDNMYPPTFRDVKPCPTQRIAELEAELDRLRVKRVHYSCGHSVEDWVLRENCPVCDAIVADSLSSQIEELEAEVARLLELIRDMDIEHDSGWWSRDVRERIAGVLGAAE